MKGGEGKAPGWVLRGEGGAGAGEPFRKGIRRGHHSSWPGLRTLGGLVCHHHPMGVEGMAGCPLTTRGSPGSEAGHRELRVPFPQALPFSLSWSEGWATYGSASNLCCRLLAACCPHILWVLTPTSSPQGLGNPQTVAIQTCSGTTLHEKINIYIYILFCLFLKKEKGGVLCFLGEQRVPTLSCPLLPLEILWGQGQHCECSLGSTVSVSGGHWGMECVARETCKREEDHMGGRLCLGPVPRPLKASGVGGVAYLS